MQMKSDESTVMESSTCLERSGQQTWGHSLSLLSQTIKWSDQNQAKYQILKV